MKEMGDIALMVAASGLIVFAVLFLGSVRWWTDVLGRTLASVMVSVFVIMSIVLIRLKGVPIPNLMLWRLLAFTAFGLTTWIGVVVFVWAQFLTRRLRKWRKDHG